MTLEEHYPDGRIDVYRWWPRGRRASDGTAGAWFFVYAMHAAERDERLARADEPGDRPRG